jgi:deoxyribonuclease V
MIAAIDVHYENEGPAQVAAIVFENFADQAPHAQYTHRVDGVEAYTPGAFYRRELPCILTLLSIIKEAIDTVIIDGYVNLGELPGLGAHLYHALGEQVPVIGVAKSFYRGSTAQRVYRGNSAKPLYVSAAGIPTAQAAYWIASMHGDHRIPTLLKAVDRLARVPPRNKKKPKR